MLWWSKMFAWNGKWISKYCHDTKTTVHHQLQLFDKELIRFSFSRERNTFNTQQIDKFECFGLSTSLSNLLTKIQYQQNEISKYGFEFSSLYGTKLLGCLSVLTNEFIFPDWSQFHHCYSHLYGSNQWWWWWPYFAPWLRNIHKIDIPLESIVFQNNACTKMSPQAYHSRQNPKSLFWAEEAETAYEQ